MDQKYVIYREERVPQRWLDKMQEAQSQTSYVIDGRECQRIRYGEEEDDWGADQESCHDCGVWKGHYHIPGCDVERCPACGEQSISCDCAYEGDDREGEEQNSKN